jgi:hypothetical protein
MSQLSPIAGESSAGSLSISSSNAPLPTELFGEQLTPAYYSDMVLVRGLTLVRDGGVFAVIGNRRVRLWNKFQIKSPKISLPSNITNKYYDVTAIYGTDVVNGEVIDELYLLKSPVEGDSPDVINASLAEETSSDALYNLQGQRVGKDFKGIVVRNGKKMINNLNL